MAHLRADLEKIYRAALAAADPYTSVLDVVTLRRDVLSVGGQRYSLNRYRRVHLLGAGKASAAMARAIIDLLGKRLHGGVLVVRDLPDEAFTMVKILQAGHPEPDERGLEASRQWIQYLKTELSPEDLLLVLISGGASALLPAPVEPISLADKQDTTRALLTCGATIHEINMVRKHLSRLKGGRLLNYSGGAAVVTLLVSDVVGDDPSTIGSGPTSPDPSTFADCLEVIRRYQITSRIPVKVLRSLESGARSGESSETLKETDPRSLGVQNCFVSSNRESLKDGAHKAAALGYQPLILSSSIQGSAADLARFYVAITTEILATGHPLSAPCCLLSGGEATVRVKGPGKGGRNQEFALWCLHETQSWKSQPVLFGSLGSDGSDGPTDAAGAVVSPATRARARELQLDSGDYLDRNDSYHFFQQLDDLIITGPTGTNVMDFHLALVGNSPLKLGTRNSEPGTRHR